MKTKKELKEEIKNWKMAQVNAQSFSEYAVARDQITMIRCELKSKK
jgi:hypothetical protein